MDPGLRSLEIGPLGIEIAHCSPSSMRRAQQLAKQLATLGASSLQAAARPHDSLLRARGLPPPARHRMLPALASATLPATSRSMLGPSAQLHTGGRAPPRTVGVAVVAAAASALQHACGPLPGVQGAQPGAEASSPGTPGGQGQGGPGSLAAGLAAGAAGMLLGWHLRGGTPADLAGAGAGPGDASAPQAAWKRLPGADAAAQAVRWVSKAADDFEAAATPIQSWAVQVRLGRCCGGGGRASQPMWLAPGCRPTLVRQAAAVQVHTPGALPWRRRPAPPLPWHSPSTPSRPPPPSLALPVHPLPSTPSLPGAGLHPGRHPDQVPGHVPGHSAAHHAAGGGVPPGGRQQLDGRHVQDICPAVRVGADPEPCTPSSPAVRARGLPPGRCLHGLSMCTSGHMCRPPGRHGPAWCRDALSVAVAGPGTHTQPAARLTGCWWRPPPLQVAGDRALRPGEPGGQCRLLGGLLLPGHDHLAGVRGGEQAGCMADAWADA